MKAVVLILVLSFLAVLPVGCGKKDKDENKQDDQGAVDAFTDYVTGKTQIEAGQAAKRKLIWIAIQSAVDGYRGLEEGEPASLQQLVEAKYLEPDCTKDEYGKPLQSSVQNGKLVVRSVKADGTVSWEKAF